VRYARAGAGAYGAAGGVPQRPTVGVVPHGAPYQRRRSRPLGSSCASSGLCSSSSGRLRWLR
jgi:hypothetical protein